MNIYLEPGTNNLFILSGIAGEAGYEYIGEVNDISLTLSFLVRFMRLLVPLVRNCYQPVLKYL
jgi:hypothetical protein